MVYCINCRSYNMMGCHKVIHINYHNPIAPRRVYATSLEHNANNNCKYYEPSLWFRFVTRLRVLSFTEADNQCSKS